MIGEAVAVAGLVAGLVFAGRALARRVRFWRSPPVRAVREFRRRERIPRHS
jgi:hypothetical protein